MTLIYFFSRRLELLEMVHLFVSITTPVEVSVNKIEIGLFLGSGKVLASAGPGGAVLAYAIMGTVISSVISSVGEMTALMPVNAPMMEFPRRFLDRGVGFAVGWVYW
jgi:amino acid transporter